MAVVVNPGLDRSGFSVRQSPDFAAYKGQNVTLQCTQIGTSYNGMYWFRKRPSGSMELIVYYYIKMGTPEDKFKQKVSAKKEGNSLDLTVKELESTDSAIYFCAKQDAQHDKLLYKLNKNCNTPTTNTHTQHLLTVAHKPGFSQSNRVIQSPPDLFGNHQQSVNIQCEHSEQRYDQILWYRQDHGLTFIGYQLRTSSQQIENDFMSKVEIVGDGSKNVSLTITNLLSNDSAVYFCAAYYTVLHICFILYKNLCVNILCTSLTPAPVA
ncbi:hypothetical protein QTP86_003377 [Hemibagrus guttatus]|nr:hypothetical protein QTP86_003377 [Hemibagrus guttatus]